MIILFIDDAEDRHSIIESMLGKEHTILHAYNYEEAILAFESSQHTIGLAMFDHDLGDFREENGEVVEYNGAKVAGYVLSFLDEKKFPARAIAHSTNYSGAANIASKLRSAGIHTDILTFSSEMVKSLASLLKPQ